MKHLDNLPPRVLQFCLRLARFGLHHCPCTRKAPVYCWCSIKISLHIRTEWHQAPGGGGSSDGNLCCSVTSQHRMTRRVSESTSWRSCLCIYHLLLPKRMAGKEQDRSRSSTLLERSWRANSGKKQPAAPWKMNSYAKIPAEADSWKDPYRTPRSAKMLTPCNDLSLVARNLTRSREHGETVFDMHQKPRSPKATDDPCRTTRIPLAEDWNRPLPFQERHLSTCRLVLKIPWDSETLDYNFSQHHWSTEFTKVYDFHHMTSSPLFPQSKGQAEWTKSCSKGSKDPHLTLLTYSATSLRLNFSWEDVCVLTSLTSSVVLVSCSD